MFSTLYKPRQGQVGVGQVGAGQVGACTAGHTRSPWGYCLPLTLANAWIEAVSYSPSVAYWISDHPSAAQIKVWAAWPFTCRAVKVPPVKWASLTLLHWSTSHEEQAFHRAWSPSSAAKDLRACLNGKPSYPRKECEREASRNSQDLTLLHLTQQDLN